MSGGFTVGTRVVVEHPTMGRTYGNVEAAADEVVSVRADGYINVWNAPHAMVQPAACARDMVIDDIMNIEMLREVIQVPFLGSLWTHGDSGMLTPYVSETSFGDGMHLLTIATINQRPNYHVVRVCSTWREGSHGRWGDVYREDTIGEHIDEVLTAIEEECGQRYYWREDACTECEYEDCRCGDGDPWPAIDADGGCSWGEIRWPWLMKQLGQVVP